MGVGVGGELGERGFMVPAIRPPTVAEGRARLRVSLCSEHTQGEIDGLLEALGAAVEKIGE